MTLSLQRLTISQGNLFEQQSYIELKDDFDFTTVTGSTIIGTYLNIHVDLNYLDLERGLLLVDKNVQHNITGTLGVDTYNYGVATWVYFYKVDEIQTVF